MTRFFVLTMLLLPLQLAAGQVQIQGARVWSAPDQTRLVIDAAQAVTHKVFALDDPHRLVIDIPDARLTAELPVVDPADLLLLGIRSGIRKGDDLRVVLDLKQRVRAKSFLLEPNDQYPHRLVVDLMPAQQQAQGIGQSTPPARHLSIRTAPERPRDVIVAIDAGHGGEDPGAIGPRGTREKDVTMAIARRLARLVEKERGMKPVLIREGDYYIGLRKRMALARKAQADLFVSIHADAFRDRRVRGSSVYTLSQRGASSEAAKWLADRENRADLIGGIDLTDGDDVLASVLLDMTQSATLEQSVAAAEKVLDNLGRVGRVHRARVQQAGFVVLKSPDIPSLLVETAFISNPDEEKRLRDKDHQQDLAEAILGGIKAFFANYAPPGTLLAAEAPRRHVIDRGDTLLEIARRYDVSLTSLRTVNSLNGDHIRVGQVLTIPES